MLKCLKPLQRKRKQAHEESNMGGGLQGLGSQVPLHKFEDQQEAFGRYARAYKSSHVTTPNPRNVA